MGWVPLATMAVGALGAADQERTIRKQNQAKAAANRYAGIRNSKGQRHGGDQELNYNAPSVLGGALSGGLAGLGAQQAMGGTGSWFGKGISSTGNFGNVSANGANTIGANDGMMWTDLAKQNKFSIMG